MTKADHVFNQLPRLVEENLDAGGGNKPPGNPPTPNVDLANGEVGEKEEESGDGPSKPVLRFKLEPPRPVAELPGKPNLLLKGAKLFVENGF